MHNVGLMRLLAFISPLLLFAAGFACQKPVETINSTWTEYAKPFITKASIYDTIPALSKFKLSIKETKGVKVVYTSGKSTSYFEYETDPKKLITIISALPFEKGNAINDTLCRKIENTFSLSAKNVLSSDELAGANFFWSIEPKNYTYFECLKYPARHTLLINNITGRILHRIELES
jgi:hypothetical protein